MSVIMISRDGRSEEEWRELRLALAKAIEARRAETVKQGSVEDESAVAESDLPNTSGSEPQEKVG